MRPVTGARRIPPGDPALHAHVRRVKRWMPEREDHPRPPGVRRSRRARAERPALRGGHRFATSSAAGTAAASSGTWWTRASRTACALSHDEEDGFGAFFGYASCDPERAQEVRGQRPRGAGPGDDGGRPRGRDRAVQAQGRQRARHPRRDAARPPVPRRLRLAVPPGARAAGHGDRPLPGGHRRGRAPSSCSAGRSTR